MVLQMGLWIWRLPAAVLWTVLWVLWTVLWMMVLLVLCTVLWTVLWVLRTMVLCMVLWTVLWVLWRRPWSSCTDGPWLCLAGRGTFCFPAESVCVLRRPSSRPSRTTRTTSSSEVRSLRTLKRTLTHNL